VYVYVCVRCGDCSQDDDDDRLSISTTSCSTGGRWSQTSSTTDCSWCVIFDVSRTETCCSTDRHHSPCDVRIVLCTDRPTTRKRTVVHQRAEKIGALSVASRQTDRQTDSVLSLYYGAPFRPQKKKKIFCVQAHTYNSKYVLEHRYKYVYNIYL